jgi:hypothetical protein
LPSKIQETKTLRSAGLRTLKGDRGHEYECQLCCDARTSTTIGFQARVAKIRTSKANGGVVDQTRIKVYAIVHRALILTSFIPFCSSLFSETARPSSLKPFSFVIPQPHQPKCTNHGRSSSRPSDRRRRPALHHDQMRPTHHGTTNISPSRPICPTHRGLCVPKETNPPPEARFRNDEQGVFHDNANWQMTTYYWRRKKGVKSIVSWSAEKGRSGPGTTSRSVDSNGRHRRSTKEEKEGYFQSPEEEEQ